jgi:hypothetical protein
MKVAELIAHLRKLDPELPVVNIVGDCDYVQGATEPQIIFVNDAELPSIWSRDDRSDTCSVRVVWV